MHFGEKIGSSFVSVPFCLKATFPGNVAFAMSRLFTNYEDKHFKPSDTIYIFN